MRTSYTNLDSISHYTPRQYGIYDLELLGYKPVQHVTVLNTVPKCNIVVFIYLLTYFMQQSPFWEANRFAAGQEIPRILWNLKVHYRTHRCLSPVSILGQLNPAHTPTSLNTIIQSTSRSPQLSISLRFSHQNPVHTSLLHHTRYIPRLSHSSRFQQPQISGWGIKIMKLLIMKFSPIPCYLTPLRPKYSPQHPLLKHPQPTYGIIIQYYNIIILWAHYPICGQLTETTLRGSHLYKVTLCTQSVSPYKGKGKVHPVTGHQGPRRRVEV
jgi:hypothetical protein